MNKLLWTCIFIILHSNNLLCAKTKIECGYKQCPHTREGTLNVHLIPHSHMDAGWVKTFDQYYYGTKTSISSANVQLIYHSVISELLHDKRRKFTLSETAYFWRWWKEQRPATRATFRSLVQEGRVEFAGGGWTHSDSATVTYLQILDLFTWGLRKLNDTLGPCGKPKAAWQIDSYGHTREEASLLAQMGFDGLFLGRVDFKEREAMMEEDRMEFMWRGSDVLGKMSDIMTHAMFNLYNAPNGFCFDWLCGDEPVIDDADSPAYNADARVNEFISQIEKQAKYYDHDNILVTMGGDFTYQNAANWFMNIDKLINHVNSHPANLSDINIFYSTPSCYLKAIYLYGRRDKAVYTEKSDYLPYGSDASTYWTGFYTSRPSLKYFTKRAHVFLQVVKQLSVIARSGDSYELHLLRHAVSLILHHDGITGTSQQHVANDFLKTLSEAVDVCTKKVSNLISYLTPTWGGSRRSKNSQQFVLCHQLNISQCRFVESQESVLLLVYNPLTVKAYHYVRLPSIALHYSIRDYNDEEVEYQINPLPPAIVNLPGRSSSTVQELWFEAENIPPLGFSSYYLTPLRDQLEENNYKKNAQNAGEADSTTVPYISNEYLRVSIDKTTGLLESIQHVDGVKVQVSQNFYFYSQGRQQMQSGAYSFRPDQMRPVPVTERVQYSIIRGALVKEIRQRFCEWISQVVRLYRGEEMVEIEWVVGPVPIGSDLGKEVVSILKTNISNGGEFFTDSNGRQMMKRTCWNETAIQQQKKPVPACYFPVTSRICIRSLNSSAAMCVLTDRTQGGTSYDDGEIELMVHRRLLTDDGFGLEEPLNEEAHGVGLVVKGTHRIMFGNFKHDDNLNLSEMAAQAARRWEMEPWLFLTSGDKVSRRKWQNIRNKRYSALRLHGLPAYIHILTLEPWKAGSVLLRLENILEASKGRFRGQESIEESKSHITVDLRKIFLQHKIKLVRETTLAANQWLEDARQMDWSTRYVYSGGDDGILPEDMPDDENRSVKRDAERQDSGPYSDEETEYPKKYVGRRIAQRIRPKLKQVKTYNYERRRRSVNDSVNINDNIINDTVQDFKLELKINDPIETTRGVSNMATTERYKNTTIKNSQKQPKLSRKTPKLSFWNKPKEHQSTRVPHWDVEEEMGSSEEDFSANLRKRSSNKKNRSSKKPKEEIVIDDSDDGITKSMYEMYYKPLPRNPYKKKKQQGIVRRKKPKRSEDSDEPTEKPAERKVRSERQDISKRQGRSERQDMSERQGRSERQDMFERQGRSERQDMSERQGRSERQDISERQGRSERPDRMERQNRIERQDRTERQDRNERVERSRRNRNGIKKKRINADIPFFMTDRRNNRRVAEVQKEKTEVAEVEDDTPLNGTERSREDNTSPKTLKRRRAEPLTVMTTKRDTDDDEPDDDDDDEEEEDEYEDSWRKHRVRRNKRTLPKDEEVEANNASEQDSSEPEHIVTLRPTQIRTFIIWFEPAKKSYVVI